MDKKTALITGASGDIGAAIAKRYGEEGYNVMVHYHSNENKAQNVVDTVNQAGGKAEKIKGNIASFDEAKNIVDTTIETFGRIDILVNNSGVTKDTLMLRMKEDDFDKIINVNLKGSWNMIKHVTRSMFKQKSGRIINISSVVGLIGNPGQANYVASKAGINGLTKSLAKEYGAKNITVNAIAPGFIETKMTEQLDESIKDAYQQQIPLGRFGSPQDVASAATFLASDDAAYISGQIISVNGGMI